MSAIVAATPGTRPVGPLEEARWGNPGRRGILGKLLTGFGAVLLLTALIGVLGLYSMDQVHRVGTMVYDDRTVPIRDLARMRAELADVDSQSLRAILDQSDRNRLAYPAAAEKAAANVDRLLAGYEQTGLVDDEKR